MPDSLIMLCALLRAPVLVRLGLQSWTESWPGRRGQVLSLHCHQGTTATSPRLETAGKYVTGIRTENYFKVWKRRFAGEEGQTEVSMAAKWYNPASLIWG